MSLTFDNIVNTNGHSDDRRLSKPGMVVFNFHKHNLSSIKIETIIMPIMLNIQIWFTVNFFCKTSHIIEVDYCE